ncbi:MAG: 2'-5' RNA ligase family protein [Flavobacteriaceae bacterium]|nr:2'-5' RNA ligase family protein [Flavobacteriaceae bacterium]
MTRALYLIALVPPEEIRIDIKLFKEEMKSRFGAAHALKLPAHITLQMPFWMERDNEIILKEQLHALADAQKPFPVQLDGFGCFAPCVIFVGVANPAPIVMLHSQLQQTFPSELFVKGHEQHAEIHPHLTIATRDLDKKDFPMAWEVFRSRHYAASFIAQDFSLFKHNGKIWETAQTFCFGKPG